MCSVFCFVMLNKYKSYKSLDIELEKINKEIEIEQAHSQNLKQQLNSYEDDEYIERVARNQLGMIKSDEIVFEEMKDE